MAISRTQLVKELEPGLNALFGLEYNRYENEHAEIFSSEASDRAFEEEVMLSGFGSAPVKAEDLLCNLMMQMNLLQQGTHMRPLLWLSRLPKKQ